MVVGDESGFECCRRAGFILTVPTKYPMDVLDRIKCPARDGPFGNTEFGDETSSVAHVGVEGKMMWRC